MESNVKLYGEICKLLKPRSDKTKDALWKILRKYSIHSLSDNHSFDEGWHKFMEARLIEGCSKSTVNSYNNTIKSLKAFLGPKTPSLEEITKDDIRRYLKYLEDERKIAKSSLANKLGILKNFFMWLEYENYIFKNPAKTIMLKIPKEPRHALSQEDLDKLKAACRTVKEKALFNFLLNTGCRVSEVTGLKLEDVDWENNQARVFGKGSKYRTVFFNDTTKEALLRYKAKNKSEYLFYSEKNEYRPIRRFAISQCLKRLGERAGIERNIHPHLFRHSFATNALASGMPLTTIQKILGHADISTTTIYAETNLDKAKKEYHEIFGK